MQGSGSSEEAFKIQKLHNGSNWNTWKFQMKVVLQSAEVFCVVNGDLVKPGAAADQAEALASWIKKDALAQKYIVTSLDKQPLNLVMTCTSSKEMWDKLLSVYDKKSEISTHLLWQQFYNFSKNDSEDMATHISRLENLVQQLKNLGETVSNNMLITKVLMTLPASYQHFATSI